MKGKVSSWSSYARKTSRKQGRPQRCSLQRQRELSKSPAAAWDDPKPQPDTSGSAPKRADQRTTDVELWFFTASRSATGKSLTPSETEVTPLLHPCEGP